MPHGGSALTLCYNIVYCQHPVTLREGLALSDFTLKPEKPAVRQWEFSSVVFPEPLPHFRLKNGQNLSTCIQ